MSEESALSWSNPGNVTVSGDRAGYYDGCVAVGFTGDAVEVAEKINAYFADPARKQHLVIYSYPVNGGVVMLHGRWLTNDEKIEFDHFSRSMGVEMQKFRDGLKESKRADREAKEKQEQEKARLITLGQKCEQNHSPAIAEKRADKKGKK